MARNKYPEETRRRILQVSRRLFLEKGYEHTTVQDIVDALGDLTKGAVYHHFASKEDIFSALGDELFSEDNPFEQVRRGPGTGLEKMRRVIELSGQNAQRTELTRQALPLLENPRVLAQTIESDEQVLAPLWRSLLEEGNRDGSLHTEYADELAEVLPLLTNVWMALHMDEGGEAVMRRVRFLARMLEGMGVPLFDEHLMASMEQYVQTLTRSEE